MRLGEAAVAAAEDRQAACARPGDQERRVLAGRPALAAACEPARCGMRAGSLRRVCAVLHFVCLRVSRLGCVFVCVLVSVRACVRVRVRACVRVFVFGCLFVCLFVCLYMLVCFQWTTMLRLTQSELTSHGHNSVVLDGTMSACAAPLSRGCPPRCHNGWPRGAYGMHACSEAQSRAIEAFNTDDSVRVFLVSLKAGGADTAHAHAHARAQRNTRKRRSLRTRLPSDVHAPT